MNGNADNITSSEEFMNNLPNLKELTQNITSDMKECNSASMVKFIGDIKNDGTSGRFNHLQFPHCFEMLKVFNFR